MKCIGSLLLLILILMIPAASIAQTSDQDQDRAKRAKELEAKVTVVKKQLQSLKEKWNEASGQLKSNIEADLADTKVELRKSYDGLQKAYEQDVKQLDDKLNDVWAKFEGKSAEARAMAVKELESIRAQWNSAFERRQRVHQERVKQLRGELDDVERQIKSTSEETSDKWNAKRAGIRKEYQQYANRLSKSYREYIASLKSETQRLQKNAQAAGDELKAAMMAKSDELNAKTNAAYDELHAGYKEIADKANSYIEETTVRMKTASGNAKIKIQAELNDVSQSIASMQAEQAASYEAYRDSLNAQIASIKKRAGTASAEAKASMNDLAMQLQAKREQAETQMVNAYKSYAASIQSDIDRMNANLDQADADTRAEMVKAIEKRQAELEKIKEKLK